MSAVILVPVKNPCHAKVRLAPLLAPVERSELAWAMFNDIHRTLCRLRYPVALVTNYERAAARAKDSGWRVLWEANQVSESRSIDLASRELFGEGIGKILRLPADIPFLQPDDVEEVLSADPGGHSAVLVPSRDGMGTNALLRTPPDLFPSRFGTNSFVLHQHVAQRIRAALGIVHNQNIGLDLDDASDVASFLDRPSDTQTSHFLFQHNIKERIAELASQQPAHPGIGRDS